MEVLLHLHGHKWPGYGVGYETAEDETLYRFEQALDQFSKTKRPIIAVLPQGGSLSEFGKTTERDRRGRLHPAGDRRRAGGPVAGRRGAAAGGVILSGHSGAGGRFADMFGTAKMPYRPGLEGFFSFDTINGKTGQKVSEIVTGNEYKQHVKFILGRLDADLAMLAGERKAAAGKKEDEIQAALAAKLVREGFRFRAFYTEAPHVRPDGTLDPNATAVYADRYFLLKGARRRVVRHARGRPRRQGRQGVRRAARQLHDRARRHRAHEDDGRRAGARAGPAAREHAHRARRHAHPVSVSPS